MKTVTKIAAPLLALGLAAGFAIPALADQPGQDWMPADQVIRTLEQDGYGQVTKLEADDGHWEGKAVKDGRAVKFHADPRTGAVTKEKPAKVEQAGKDAGKDEDGDDD